MMPRRIDNHKFSVKSVKNKTDAVVESEDKAKFEDLSWEEQTWGGKWRVDLMTMKQS